MSRTQRYTSPAWMERERRGLWPAVWLYACPSLDVADHGQRALVALGRESVVVVRGEDGRLVFHLPMADKKLPGIAAEDIGRCAYGIFCQGSKWIGERLGVSGEHLSGAEMAAALANALGEEVQYNALPFEVFRGFDFPGADDLGNMFQFKADFTEDYRGLRDVERARTLEPRLRTFAAWLEENTARIPIS